MVIDYSWKAEHRCFFALPKDHFSAAQRRAHRGIDIPSFFVTQRHPAFSRKATTLIPAVRYPISPLCGDDDGIHFRGVTDLSRRNPSCRSTRKGNRRPVRLFLFPLAPSRRLTTIWMLLASTKVTEQSIANATKHRMKKRTWKTQDPILK